SESQFRIVAPPPAASPLSRVPRRARWPVATGHDGARDSQSVIMALSSRPVINLINTRYLGPLHLGVGHAKGVVDLELPPCLDFFSVMSRPSRPAPCFPLSGHSPTRGYGRALWIVGRIERPPGRPAVLRMAAVDPPLGG